MVILPGGALDDGRGRAYSNTRPGPGSS